MGSTADPTRHVRFGPFEVDLRTRELWRDGERLKVPDQSIKVLSLLIEGAGDVVTREDLHRRLWPNGTIVEFDRSINAAIKRLRDALQDSAEAPSFIETLPRRGYRFVAAVERVATRVRAEPDPVEATLPEAVSRYRILRKLGAGAMGVVYEAEDTISEGSVALKFLPEELADDARALERFEREARTASSLQHPNICSVFGVQECDGSRFIVMEYIDGKSLEEVVPRDGMPVTEVLSYAIQIADALAAAHAAGIIHRDLKPSNVMLRQDGVLKLLDFGLAKVLSTGPQGVDVALMGNPMLTGEGAILGTLQYMAPEQLEGKEATAATDIFAFGMLIYEMATGRKAFEGKSQANLIAAILEREPAPMQEVQPLIPPALAGLVRTCLVKQPEARWQTMHDVLLQLKWIADPGTGVTASAVAIPKRRRLTRAWAATLFLGAGFGLAAWVWHTQQRANAHLPLPESATPLTSNHGWSGHPSFSPDGNQVVYFVQPEGSSDPSLYIQILGAPGPPRRLTSFPGDFSPAWSPDGRYVSFLRSKRADYPKAAVMWIPLTGTTEQVLAEIALPAVDNFFLPGPHLAWMPDGRSLVTIDCGSPNTTCSLWLLPVDTREKQRLTTPLPRENDDAPAVSPDGRWLVFSRLARASTGDSQLFLIELSPDHKPKSAPKQITFGEMPANSPGWAPDGRTIVFTRGVLGSQELWRMPLSGGRPGTPERLLFAGDKVYYPTIAPRGDRLIFARAEGGDFEIWRVEVPAAGNKARPVKLISSQRSDEDPSYSPDGSKIAFKSDRSGKHFQIWVCRSDGSEPIQLTAFPAASGAFPHWYPDARSILFGFKDDMFRISTDGGIPRRVAPGGSGTLSHDGSWIYFTSDRTGEYQIWRMSSDVGAAGAKASQITRRGGTFAIESPEGRYLYYTQGEHRSPLMKVPVAGGDEVPVIPSVYEFNFAVAEDGIYYIPPPEADRGSIQFLSFSTGKTIHIADVVSPGLVLSISPRAKNGGRSLVYEVPRPAQYSLMLVEHFR